jgi:hypothetical protein
MAQNIVFPEWLNSNSVRNYPVAENCSRQNNTESFTIPNSFFVAAQINHSRQYLTGFFYISRLIVSVPFIKVFIGYKEGNLDPVEIGSFEIDNNNFSKFSYYSFVGVNEHSSIVGSFAMGDIQELIHEGLGEFQFEPSSTKLEVNCRFISVPSMQAIEIYNSDDTLIHKATDTLKIRAGENIRITYIPTENQGTEIPDLYGCIKIDAVLDENIISEPDACESVKSFFQPCIKYINGVPPDSDGKFWMEESECIGIDEYPGNNSIRITDLCSESCCGCVDLSFLTEGLEQLKQQEERLRELVLTTQGTQSELLANLIANL